MFRILFLTDTHLGAAPDSWGRHPPRPDLLPTLFRALAERLRKDPVDLVVHGGDLTSDGSRPQQEQAAALLDLLPAPSVLVLGNHDLQAEGAYGRWTREWARLLPGTDYSLRCDEADLYVLCNQWRGAETLPAYAWSELDRDIPCLTDQQLAWLERQLARRHDRPAIVAVHHQLHALPLALTGVKVVNSEAPPGYAAALSRVLDKHPRVRLVLTGHCHATCAVRAGERLVITTGAFCEPPFHYRLIEIKNASIAVTTHAAVDPAAIGAEMNPDNAWSTGRESDRTFVLE